MYNVYLEIAVFIVWCIILCGVLVLTSKVSKPKRGATRVVTVPVIIKMIEDKTFKPCNVHMNIPTHLLHHNDSDFRVKHWVLDLVDAKQIKPTWEFDVFHAKTGKWLGTSEL